MNEKEYLLLVSQGNIKPLQEKLRALNGFYNGVGYAFPMKNEQLIKEIVSSLPKVKIHTLPLDPGQSFASFQQSHKAAFYQEKLIETEKQIFKLMDSSDISESTKQSLSDLFHEKERLKKEIEWTAGIEKALSMHNESLLDLKFINERTTNYLLEEAPPIPKLINYLDSGIQKPFIRKGITAMLVGAGGIGKTHALAQLGLSIATGEPWLGIYPVEKPGYVFVGFGENSENDIHRLIRKAAKSFSKRNARTESSLFEKNQLQEAGNRLIVKSFTGISSTFIQRGQPTQFYESFLSKLKEKEPEEGWSCIILDPISRFIGADAEIDNASATQFIALLERIALELSGNPTVIFGHHMNKSGINGINTDQSAARGSSAITDGVRWQANLEKIKRKDTEISEEQYELSQISIRPVKSNFTALLPPQKLEQDEFGCFRAINDETNRGLRTLVNNRKMNSPT